jgi:hypothetical protein
VVGNSEASVVTSSFSKISRSSLLEVLVRIGLYVSFCTVFFKKKKKKKTIVHTEVRSCSRSALMADKTARFTPKHAY